MNKTPNKPLTNHPDAHISAPHDATTVHPTIESPNLHATIESVNAEKNTRARMALLQIAQQENLLPTDEEIDKQLAERAEKTKKTVEEIKAGTDIAALRRNEGIRKAADWVIDHSTIEEKVESK